MFVASSEASLQHSSAVAVLLSTSCSWSYLPSIFGGYRLRFPPEDAPLFDAKEPNKYISAARIVKTKKLMAFILPSNHSVFFLPILVCYSKSCIQQEEESFYQHTGLKFEEETSKMLHLEHGFVWC